MKQSFVEISRFGAVQRLQNLCLRAIPIVLAVGFVAQIQGRDGRLDRENLLEYRAANGDIRPVRSVADWQIRRAEILAGAQAIMGPFPGESKRVPLDVRIEEEKDFGSYVRRLITYSSEPGSRTPALLFLPKAALQGDARLPGALCLMGTGGYRLADHPADLETGARQHIGERLAERGIVAIAPAYPTLGFGSRQHIALEYNPDFEALGYASGTMKAVWDNVRALDLLESLPFVKRGGFGTIGHSLGGHNSIYTALFDERIRAVVSSCGFDSFRDYFSERTPSVWTGGRGWTQGRYMPKLGDMDPEDIPFDFHELVGVLAPRAFFVNAPVGDSNFKWRSVARVTAAGAQIYKLYGVPGLLRVVHPDAGHDFPPEVLDEALDWMQTHL
jgi:dienelactone hydrolase